MLDNDTSDLELILQRIVMLQELPEPEALKRLIDALRVVDEDEQNADARIDELIELLQANPEYGSGLAAFILRLIIQYRQIPLYTDTGIASDQSFLSSVSRLISHRFLPLLPDEDSVVELANYLFDKRSDWRWVESISEDGWNELLPLIRPDEKDLSLVAQAKNSILNAIVVLSYRVSGIGPQIHDDLVHLRGIAHDRGAIAVDVGLDVRCHRGRQRRVRMAVDLVGTGVQEGVVQTGLGIRHRLIDVHRHHPDGAHLGGAGEPQAVGRTGNRVGG